MIIVGRCWLRLLRSWRLLASWAIGAADTGCRPTGSTSLVSTRGDRRNRCCLPGSSWAVGMFGLNCCLSPWAAGLRAECRRDVS